MNEVTRICAQCGQPGQLDARYCAACGYDTQAGLPAPRGNTLPVAIGKAALPVLAGAAGLLVRAGWKLLKQRLTQAVADQAVTAMTTPKTSQPQPAPQEPLAPRRPRRIIHIRSSWAVGDANGVWRKGASEHTIEIDD